MMSSLRAALQVVNPRGHFAQLHVKSDYMHLHVAIDGNHLDRRDWQAIWRHVSPPNFRIVLERGRNARALIRYIAAGQCRAPSGLRILERHGTLSNSNTRPAPTYEAHLHTGPLDGLTCGTLVAFTDNITDRHSALRAVADTITARGHPEIAAELQHTFTPRPRRRRSAPRPNETTRRPRRPHHPR